MDPPDEGRALDGAGVEHRGGARLHATRSRPGAAHKDGPAGGRRAQPGQRSGLRRVHQQHRPRQAWKGGRDRAEPAQREQGRPRGRDRPVARRPHGAHFDWNLLLICGDPATAGTYFGGYTGPVSPIACPDNVAFDSTGTLWVSTDGQAGSIGHNDALDRVTLTGRERGKVEQLVSVPVGAETCGPVIHDKDGSAFVAVQPSGRRAPGQSHFRTSPTT